MDRREIYTLTGSIVRIAAPDGASVLLFSVESAAADMAVLRPCNSESKEFAKALDPGTELQLTAGTSDGVLHGRLRVQRWSPAQRMLVVDNPPLEFTQRREAFRVRAQVPVEVLVTDAEVPEGARTVSGATHDLSPGGCSFTVTGVMFEPGTRVLLVLRTQRQPILAVAEVLGRHPDARNTFRARFDQITPFDQTVLSAELRRLEVAKVNTPRMAGVR
jgi:c-di-GMP-binding flagellar brake protein YcgR